MLRFKNRIFVSTFLLAVVAVCMSLAFAACKDGDKSAKYGVGEEGVYYYDKDASTEYLMSLQSGTYMISAEGAKGYSGTYSYKESEKLISFKTDGGESFAASFSDDAMQLAIENTPYTFLKKVNYTVTFVDGSSSITQSVTYGKQAAAPEKDESRIFIGWYEDASFTMSYKFDTAVTGDTTLYAYYIDIDSTIANYGVTFIVDGETIYTTETQNGIVYDIPEYSGILGWWVSDTNEEDALTYRYDGQTLNEATKLFAVKEGSLGASVYDDRITWEATVSSVTVTIDGEAAFSASGNSQVYDFTALGTGVHYIAVSGGNLSQELVYVCNGLARVSTFAVYGNVLVYNAVENAQYYYVSVFCRNPAHEHTRVYNGNTLTYDFSNCEMGKDGIQFTVYAYAQGYVESVSDTFVYALILDETKVSIDEKTDTAMWTAVAGATGYEVYIGDEYIETVTTTEYSFKYYEQSAEIEISVKPVAPGYYSETSAVVSYTKTTLRTPEIIGISEYCVTWTEVEGAAGYEVNVNGKIIDVFAVGTDEKAPTKIYIGSDDDYYSYIIDGVNVISVMALSDDGNHSQFGDAVYATELTMSPVLSYKDGVVTWQYVLAAGVYYVEYDGAVEAVDGKNSFDITFTHSGENVVRVYFDDADSESSFAEITIYAYAIVFDTRGGGTVDTIYVASGDAVRLEELTSDDYGSDMMVFNGWYTLPDLTGDNDATLYGGDGVKIESGAVFDYNGTLVLYASWSRKKIGVSLNAGTYGAMKDGVAEGVQISYGSDTYTLPVPTVTDSTRIFYGWYSDSNGRGIRYTDENGHAVSGTKFEGEEDATLYAYYIEVFRFSPMTYQQEELLAVYAVSGISYVSEITVPATAVYNGVEYEVGLLEATSFNNRSSLVTVNLPDTIRYISTTNNGYTSGSGAFAGCENLKNVNIIPSEGFFERNYYSADGVLFCKDDATGGAELVYYPYGRTASSYTVPDCVCNEYEHEDESERTSVIKPVTSIASRAFHSHYELVSVTVPASVTVVRSEAFYNCTNLENAIFETEDATPLTIEPRAFRNCTSLEKVTLPSRLVDFDPTIFTDCAVLSYISVSGNGGNYSSTDGLLCNASGNEVIYCPKGRFGEIGIGETSGASSGISSIGAGAFESCVLLTKVTIGRNISYVGEGAFSGCTGMQSLVFEGQGTGYFGIKLSIDSKAFYGCTNSNFTEVYLPERLEYLGESAFGNCSRLVTVYYDSWAYATTEDLSGLQSYAFCSGPDSSGSRTNYVTKIVLGENVPVIDFAAIFGGSSLLSVEIAEGNQYYSTNTDGTLIYDKNRTELLYCATAVKGRVTLDDTIKSIADNAFFNCTYITEIVLNDGLETIGSQAFYNCTSLKTINLPEGLKEIGDEAFYNCVSLTSIAIPSSLERLGGYDSAGTLVSMNVFTDCTALSVVTIADGNDSFVAKDNVIYLAEPDGDGGVAAKELVYCPVSNAVSEIVIPSTVTSIWGSAFKDNVSVIKISFDGEVEDGFTIGSNAFQGAVNLQTVELPKGLTEISGKLFYQCESLVYITIPYSVTKVGAQAFYNCYALEYVYFESADTDKGEAEAALEFAGGTSASTGGEFGYTSNLIYINIPDRTTTLSSFMFQNSGVQNVVIGAGVTSIPSSCFANATNLQNVRFGETDESESKLISIGSYAFQSVGGSYDLILPEGVTTMGEWVFNNSTGLVNIYFPGTLMSVGDAAFTNCTCLEKVEFADDINIDFDVDSMFYNCPSLKAIEIPQSVKTLSREIFGGCTSLESITFKTNADDKASIETINKYAFSNTGIASFTFPETTAAKIDISGGEIFRWCDNLTEITLSSGVQSDLDVALGQSFHITTINIGMCTAYAVQDGVLYGVTDGKMVGVVGDLGEEVTLPYTLTVIGSYAFQYETSLKSIKIPLSVTTIGDYAFQGCSSLESITFYTPTDEEIEENGTQYTPATSISMGNFCFRYTAIKEFTMPEAAVKFGTSVSATGEGGQFYGCASLETVVLSSATTFLSYNMFYGCSSLTVVTYTGDTEFDGSADYLSVGYMNFPSTLGYLGGHCFDSSGIITARIPYVASASSTRIGSDVFRSCDRLVTVVFDEGVTYMGSEPFYNCSALESVTIPETVTEIAGFTFYQNTSLKHVTIPESVTTIGQKAFQGCTALEDINLPGSLTSVAANLFYECSSLVSVTFTNLTGCTVATLPNYTFYGCTKLKNVELPYSVTKFGTYCFQNCASLESIDVSNVTEFGTYCFYGCESLKSFEMSPAVTSIGTYMFWGCSSLENVVIAGTFTALKNRMFYGCSSLKQITIPDDITYLGTYTFYGCSSLEEIVMPSSLYGLGTAESTYDVASNAYTFYGCTSLKKVVLNDDIVAISGYVFTGCESLKIVTYRNDPDYSPANDEFYMENGYFALPSDMTAIGTYAFADTGLIIVTLPKFTATFGYLNAIGTHAFDGCRWLKTVTFDGETTRMGDYMFTDCVSLVSVTIPKGVYNLGAHQFQDCTSLEEVSFLSDQTDLSEYAFSSCVSLTEISVPRSIDTVSDYAFDGCASLKTVQFGGNVTSIGNYAFRNCTSLEEIALPELLTTIGDYAFAGSGLEEIQIYEFVTSIGVAAFGGCSNLVTITIDPANARYRSVDGLYIVDANGKLVCASASLSGNVTISGNDMVEIGEYAFYGANEVTEIALTGVTAVDDYAFAGLVGLSKISLGDVENIGAYAFGGTAVDTIEISSSVSRIGDYAFYGMSRLTSVMFTGDAAIESIGAYAFAGTGLTQIELPQSVRAIGEHAFDGTSLTSVAVGSDTEEIGDFAFADMTSLASVEINSNAALGTGLFSGCVALTLVTFGSGCDLASIPDSMFSGCTALAGISLPDGLVAIGENAFEGTGLISVALPDSVVSVGNHAFYGCADLSSVSLSSSLVSIGNYAFAETGLLSVSIPVNVTAVGDYAFYGCDSLVSADLSAVKEVTLGSYSFANCRNLSSVIFGTETVLVIGNYAFADDSGVSEVSISYENTRAIGEGAFSGWTASQTIKIDSTKYYASRKWMTIKKTDTTIPSVASEAWLNGCEASVEYSS